VAFVPHMGHAADWRLMELMVLRALHLPRKV